MSATRKQTASRAGAATEKIPSIKLSGLWFSPTAARKAKKSASAPKPAAKPKAPAKPAAKPAPKAKPAAKPAPKAKPASKPAPKAKPVAKPAPKAKPVAKPAPKAKPVAKPAPKAKPATKPAPKAKPVAKPKPPEKTPAAKPATKPKPPAKPVAKPKPPEKTPAAKPATAASGENAGKPKVEPKPFHPDDVPDFGDDLDFPPPPDDTPFTADELAQFRENLRVLRAKLSGKAASLQSQSLHRYDEVNNAEDGTDAMTRNTELKKAALDEDQIKQIDAALVALGDGSYGFCQNCGHKIGTKRLLAIPFAKFCIQCQSDMEEEAARRGPAIDPDTATYED